MRAWPLLLLILACGDKKAPELDGVGNYHLGKTVLADGKAHARCIPADETTMQCIGSPAMQVGDTTATVDLYFAGKNDEAPLAEIVLAIRRCDGQAVGRWLDKQLGPPTRRNGKCDMWRKPLMFVHADLSGRECPVSFVDPKDAARIKDLEESTCGGDD